MTQAHTMLKKIVPELIELFEKRYTILRSIYSTQPVGRRTLASTLGIGERVIRTETTFLKEAGLLEISPSGMEVTREGEILLEELRDFTHQLKGLSELERQVAEILKLKRVVIVPGDADEDELVLADIGKAAAVLLKDIVVDGSIIAVTGGSTVRAVANAITRIGDFNDLLVIPARGGMGKNVEHQSNTIASIFAKKLGGQYRLLHVPDKLRAEAVDTLLSEPDIKSVIDSLKNADILIYGMGRSRDMALRRNLSQAQMELLERKGAVAEAFGYFFNLEGKIVFSSNSIGINMDDFKRIPNIIGVAGGKQKAVVIMAVLRHCPNSVLVTDEGAAREIVRISLGDNDTIS